MVNAAAQVSTPHHDPSKATSFLEARPHSADKHCVVAVGGVNFESARLVGDDAKRLLSPAFLKTRPEWSTVAFCGKRDTDRADGCDASN
jgi:hypothetical protein